MDVASQYAKARKLVEAVEYQLQQLDGPQPTNANQRGAAARPDEVRASLSENINMLQAEVAAFERVIAQQFGIGATGSEKGQLWKKRLDRLQIEAKTLRRSVERFLRVSYPSSAVAHEREQLLSGGGAQAVAVDVLLEERRSLSNANYMVDEISAVAGSLIGNLQEQGSTMKAAHRKVLDLRSSLGLSNSLMRMIQRRTLGDTIIVYGGIAVILVLVGLIFWWLKR